ncbi:MAG: hypothetical protein FWC39_02810 [Bacteroidetes bacterium]|nr:hypothetical protein [Bacteroidota bacterium]
MNIINRIGKLCLVVLSMFTLLTACSKNDAPYSYSSESTIYSTSGKRVLRELMFILKPYVIHENTKKYIVTSSITNVKILINGQEWGVFESFKVDTSRINKQIADNFYVRQEPVKYVTQALYTISNEILTTAGEYSELLERYISLPPGGYVCQIEYIELTDNDGNTHRAYPLTTEYFEVKENIVSAYIGEFEILID